MTKHHTPCEVEMNDFDKCCICGCFLNPANCAEFYLICEEEGVNCNECNDLDDWFFEPGYGEDN